jgi:hypothetical protein
MPSPFDLSTFMQDNYTGEIDTKYHNVPDGEYMAQFKELSKAVEMDRDVFNGRDVISAKARWIILDDDVKRELGLAEIIVEQDILFELTGPAANGGKIDWGINKNMAAKKIMEAFDLQNKKSRALSAWLNQVAWISVKNEAAKPTKNNPNPDPEQLYSRVKKIMPLEAGRTAYHAKMAAREAAE